AGEDIAFREALARNFRLVQTPHPYLRYRVRPGGHFDRFLDRTRVIDGRLVFTRSTPEEQSGALLAARAHYFNQVRERIGVLEAVGGPDGNTVLAGHAVRAAAEFDTLQRK